MDLAGGTGVRVSARRGWSPSSSAPSRRSSTRSSRSTGRRGSSSSPSWSPTSRCPPQAAAIRAPAPALGRAAASRVLLGPRTSGRRSCTGPTRSGLRMAAGDGPRGRRARRETEDRRPRAARTWAASPSPPTLEPGQRLRLVKFLAYGWSSQRSLPAVARPGRGGARRARGTRGWDGLLADQREYLDDFWDARRRRDRGRPELQQAVRFALFHVLQAGARAERRAIPAKGLTGPGYDGHAFWDTETFVLPVLTYTAPDAAARRPALAPRDARPGTRARRDARPGGRRRSRGGRSAARSARATGRPAPPRSTSTRTSPTP